jgi:hypothetical protein
MTRAVPRMMMMMTRINPCGGNNNATMITCINPLYTAISTSKNPSGGNANQGEQRHDHARSKRNN